MRMTFELTEVKTSQEIYKVYFASAETRNGTSSRFENGPCEETLREETF